MPKLPAVFLADAFSWDNPAALLALTSPVSAFEVIAAIISPRPVHSDPEAGLDEYEPELTARIHRLNTGRMAGIMARAGRTVAVYQGLSVPATYQLGIPLVTTIPHAKHGDDQRYDLWDDARHPIAGSFPQAREHLVRYWQHHQTPYSVVVGGAFTDLAELLRDPRLDGAFGTLTAQGSWGTSTSTLFGKEAFNIAVAREAATRVWEKYPGAMYMVPSDITRAREVAFDGANDMARLGVRPELVAGYRLHQEVTGQSRLSIHDVHPVFLMHQLVAKTTRPYTWAPTEGPEGHERFVVTSQNADLHRPLVRRFLST